MAQTDTTTQDTERSNKLRAAYTEATAQVRDAHRDEFERLYEAAAKKRGVDYKRKPSPEEKAEAEAQALFEKFPHLREKFSGVPSAD